ncbi:MAG: hypothetical protein GOVbin1096_88 [Prokaryotic dsDNA virus sp.]|jgi:hypothetical protein|nr:MAG: hypothetical protein GOVbin1096_88 [Prokaryotic dsDNA virus sp.]|tara:strand:+ start:16645 stop:16926 length:282 start_codon:yes stop_codon:yes gene_type:complete
MSKQIEKITGYNLKDFIDKIVEKVQEGYQISETNAGYPQSWGPGLYTCDVEKSSGATEKPVEAPKEPEEGTTEAPVETTEEKPARRTRRKSSK